MREWLRVFVLAQGTRLGTLLGDRPVPRRNPPRKPAPSQSWFQRWLDNRKRQAWADRRRAEYERYIRSDAWQRVRRWALRDAGHQCQWVARTGRRCACVKGLQVHHLHYRTFGREQFGDVQVLCQRHHEIADRRREKGR